MIDPDNFTEAEFIAIWNDLPRPHRHFMQYLIQDAEVMGLMGVPEPEACDLLWQKSQAYLHDYAQKHPERSHRKPRVAMSAYTDDMWQQARSYFGDKCVYCGRPGGGLLRSFRLIREHFIPTSNPDCPGATVDNILPACQGCNTSKNNRDAADWLVSRYGERKAKHILSRIETYFDSVRSAARAAAHEGAER